MGKNNNFTAQKHKDIQINAKFSTALSSYIQNNCIDCSSAHKTARNLGVSPIEIGKQLDLLDCKIIKCQLGLFGYGKQKKRLDPEITISSKLESILDTTQKDDRISCIKCWELAKENTISRLDIGSACNKKNIKIKPCQLGAF